MNSQTNYEEYKHLLTSVLKEQSEELVFRKQLKNNNVYLDAICLKNKSVSPVVYLESYFENFKSGTSIEEIANQILDVLHSSPTDIVENETRHLFDYEENKDRIFPAVINYSQNKDYLRRIPHRKFLDLAIIYKIIFSDETHSNFAFTINNCVLNNWDVSEEELYTQAIENNKKENEYTTLTLYEAVLNILPPDKHPEEITNLIDVNDSEVMLTVMDKSGFLGSSALLFPEVFKKALEDYYPDSTKLLILPSSTKEVILIPYPEDNTSILELWEMVKSVNETSVAPQEILSNENIYIYEKESNIVRIFEKSEVME